MTPKAPNSDSFLPLPDSAFHILLALADSERHGYAIMQEVARKTDGKVRLGPGTLYTSIKKLLGAGLIEESDRRPDPELDHARPIGPRRRYYRLTHLGRRVLVAEVARLAALVRAALLVIPSPRGVISESVCVNLSSGRFLRVVPSHLCALAGA